jgi:hypothetical protein
VAQHLGTFIIGLLVFSNLSMPGSFAAASSSDPQEVCAQAVRNFGKGLTHNSPIFKKCFSFAEKNQKAKPQLYVTLKTDKVDLLVVGFQNILFIKNKNDLALIAGEMSQLKIIQSIAISPDGSRIAVLNKSSDAGAASQTSLLQFMSTNNGNVAPTYIISQAELSNATSLQYSQDGEKFVLSLLKTNSSLQSEYSIISYSSFSDSRSPLKNKKPESLLLLSPDQLALQKPIAVLLVQNFLITLDHLSVTAFDLNSKKINKLWQIQIDDSRLKNLKDFNSLRYGKEKDILQVYDSSGAFAPLKI